MVFLIIAESLIVEVKFTLSKIELTSPIVSSINMEATPPGGRRVVFTHLNAEGGSDGDQRAKKDRCRTERGWSDRGRRTLWEQRSCWQQWMKR